MVARGQTVRLWARTEQAIGRRAAHHSTAIADAAAPPKLA
jgi:hypothetical protein